MNEIKQAEVKSFKFGEPLTGNADGNPEPSSTGEIPVQACVETKRRVCIRCGGGIPPFRYKSAKYCDALCRGRDASYKSAVKSGRIKNPGVGSGGAQDGEKNYGYKTGIGKYSQKAFKYYGRRCNRCTDINDLLVHHKDENRTNNSIENLEVLCKRCHQIHHTVRDTATGRYIQRDSPILQETVEV